MVLDAEVTFQGFSQTFLTKVVGVTRTNPDGQLRQTLVKRCKAGQVLGLRRELENPKDFWALAVYTKNGHQLGYLPHDKRLANHIDQGGGVVARVKAVRGGRTILDRIFGKPGVPYGCVVEITKTDPNWSEVDGYMEATRYLDSVVKTAKEKEKITPESSLNLYREAIEGIRELDGQGLQASAWRTVRYPVNRVSLLLEREKRYEEALEVIEEYEVYFDYCGLPDADIKAVAKRKSRLRKRLG